MEDTEFSLWRLSTAFSVVDAAILMVGGDPSRTRNEYGMEDYGPDGVAIKLTHQVPHFNTAFSSLKSAIRTGDLKADLRYEVKKQSAETKAARLWLLPLGPFPSNYEQSENPFAETASFAVEKEPDWNESTVLVRDIKKWIRASGETDRFFVQATEEISDDFMDNSHVHFSPELALAVSAWRGLKDVSRFPGGEKQAIANWMAKHPEAWLGKGEPSDNAKDRVATLVNWNPIGGAPKTGG